MPIYLLADQQPIKIRISFNIKPACCAIMTNDIKGLDDRKSAYADQRGGVFSTESLLFSKNSENEISLEVGAVNLFMGNNLSARLNEVFCQQSRCTLDLVKFTADNKDTLLSIDVTIGPDGKPIVNEMSNITIIKDLASPLKAEESSLRINLYEKNRIIPGRTIAAPQKFEPWAMGTNPNWGK